VVEKRFLFIPYLRVTTHFRHIQENIGLVPAKNFVLKTAAVTQEKEVDHKELVAVDSNS
jgi:hypothetical protein